MLFQDKPLSVIYFEECLINPPVFPGTQDLTGYLNELRYLALGGFENNKAISERAGEVFSSLTSKLIIATCIIAVRSQSGSKREKKKLNSAFETLLGKCGRYSGKIWNLDQHPFGGELDNEKVAIGMAKGLNFLVSSAGPGVVLENELGVGNHLVEFRYQVMRNFPPSYLRDKLWESIKEITGISLNSEGLPLH